MKTILKYSIVLCMLPVMYAQAQTINDSLSLHSVLQSVINSHPAISKAEKDMVAADEKEKLTKTAYLPDVNFSASFTYLGPVTALSLPGLGSFDLYPHDNYSAAVTVNQSIYDFGKTAKNVNVDSQNKEMIRMGAELTKQKLSGGAMSLFYIIGYLQQAVTIKLDQLNNLNQHLQFVQKKAASGSATSFDILTTQVRISAIENQITDLKATLKVQSAQLNSLMGRNTGDPVVVQNNLLETKILAPADSLIQKAYSNRDEMNLAKQKETLSKFKLEAIGAQNYPSLNAFATGGVKNGYFNSHFEDIGRLNYVVGIGLKVPLFDANRSKHLKLMTNAELDGLKQETELTRRTIATEVIECRENAAAALKKVKQSELQLTQATKAYEMANTSYTAGTITNLDLLDSYNALSESKLTLFKTQIDYSVSLLRLKIVLGEKLY